MKITWEFYGSVYGEINCDEGDVAKTLAQLLSPRGEWDTFGSNGDTLVVREAE